MKLLQSRFAEERGADVGSLAAVVVVGGGTWISGGVEGTVNAQPVAEESKHHLGQD